MSDYSVLTFFAPSLLLGIVICVAYASIYHLWDGETLQDLLFFVIVASAGFFIGQMMGFVTQVSWLKIGQLHLIEGTIGSWLLLIGIQSIRT